MTIAPTTFTRATVIACAAQWLGVGLQLADLLNGVETQSIRNVKVVLVIALAIGGVASIAQLWNLRRDERTSERRAAPETERS